MTILEVLRRSTSWLAERGVESARLDAEILVAHGLGLRRLELYTAFDREVGGDELARLRGLVRRRGDHVPVAYLTGEREFWSLPFHVREGVLVPRPETEHLVEAAAEALRTLTAPVFADVGSGSGCIAVAVLTEVPAARGHALDLSEAAVAVTAENAERHAVQDRLTIHRGDLLAPLAGAGAPPHPDWGRLDAVLSNPPYVIRGDPTMEAGVRAHEPAEALFVPGDDPLETARRVASEAREGLRPGGVLALEVGAGSAPRAAAILHELGYVAVSVRRDLGGVERVVTGRAPGG